MQRKQKRRGSVLVELALVTPLMALLLLGAIHFGRLFYIYNALDRSVRDGARYAATRTYVTTSNGTSNTSYVNVIKNVVCYGTATSATTCIVPGLTINNVQVGEVLDATTGRPERIQVYVSSYTYNGVLGTLTITNKPYMEVAFIGRYMPE
jgi:Flp pilus assembly protein TadG